MSTTTQYVFNDSEPGKTLLHILTPASTVSVNLWNPKGWAGVSSQEVQNAKDKLLECRKNHFASWKTSKSKASNKWYTACSACGIQQFTFEKPEAK